jgi:photosystem II stability/assembly factor-like uncharacterized protein
MQKLKFSAWQKSLFLAAVWLSLMLNHPAPTLAHRPHDVISSLALSPTFNQDKTLYIIVRGMPMKSTDGGKTWRRMALGLDYSDDPNFIVASSENPSILYLSTSLDGVYKSEDSGASWAKVNQGIKNTKISYLAISPHSQKVVIAESEDGQTYQTNNAGKNWQPVLKVQGKITAISFSPENPQHLLLGDSQGNLYFSENTGLTYKSLGKKLPDNETITSLAVTPDGMWFIGTREQGLFKSSDQGNTLQSVQSGIGDKNITDIIVSPNYPQDNTILVATWHKGTFLSSDKGETWQKSNRGLTKTSQADEKQFSDPHFTELQATKTFGEDKTLYLAGFDGLFQSTDGGKTWREKPTLSLRSITALGISPNYAQDKTIAIGTYEGEGYLLEGDFAKPRSIVNGLSVVKFDHENQHLYVHDPRFFDIMFSPNYAKDNTMFAALIYRFSKSTNQGEYWSEVDLPQDSWRDIFMLPSPNIAQDKTVYLAAKYGGNIYKSRNNGDKFSKVGSVGKNIYSLEISPKFTEDKTLYATTLQDVSKSVDGGVTWSSIAKDSNFAWRFLAISPNYKTDKTVVAGTNKGIFKSTDAGNTWVNLTKNKEAEYLVDGIAMSPNYAEDQTFIASARGVGLVKTTDGGKTFTEVGQDFIRQGYPWMSTMSTSKPIQFSPNYANDKTLYGFGANEAEVYKSQDGGNTWQAIPVDKISDANAELTVKLKESKILLKVYPLLRFLIALVLSLLTFWLVGSLRLERYLPGKRWQIRALGTFLTFIVIILSLSAFA